MDSRLANDIINQLQSKRERIEWTQFGSANVYIGEVTVVTVGNEDYIVEPIKSYSTVVAFSSIDYCVYVEVGKYSRTTSSQITKIYNRHFAHQTRKCFDKIK